MLIKAMALAGGLTGAVGLSQFPEYSQQYTQRLAGAVEELSWVVAQFDADATSVGLGRDAALDELSQSGRIGEARAISMGYVLERHHRLTHDLQVLNGSTLLDKTLNFWRFTEPKIAREAWADFKPAVPVSAEALMLGGAGFVAGYGLLGGLMAALMRLGRRRPARA